MLGSGLSQKCSFLNVWTSKFTSNVTSGSVRASGLSNNTAGFCKRPRLILLSLLGSTKVIFNFVIHILTPWSVDVLYSAAYTFIDIWRAIPATKLLATSSYKLGFYRYGWGSRTFRNITTDSIYILIQGWLSMTQLLLEHSWRSHYDACLENLVLNQLLISKLLFYFIPITCLFDIVLIL